MVGYYATVVTILAIAFVFTNGIVFALCFFGTAVIPCIAVAGMRWGIVRGDNQQRIGVPVVAVLLLLFAYWLSTGVSLQLFGYRISGLAFGLISAFVGTWVPLAWGPTPSPNPPQ